MRNEKICLTISGAHLDKTLSNKITAKEMKFSLIDFFSKCDQMHIFQRIWLRLLKKSLMENFLFCEVRVNEQIEQTYNKAVNNST